TSEINRIGNTTEFNGMKLLNGSKITTNGKEQIEIVGKNGTPKIATNFAKVSGVTNSAELKLTQPIKLTEQATDSINYASLANAENKNVITLSKKDGKITASAKLEDSTGMTATYENLELIQDSDTGDWICKKENNHGIEFAISKESAQAFITNGEESDTARVDLYLTKGSPAAAFDGTAGSYNLINDYLDGTGKNIAIQDDSFTLTGWNNGAARVDYDDVKIELQNATGTGKATLNVTFYSEGNVVIQDKLGLTLGALSGASQTITYNANGITFKIDAADGTTASEYMGIDIDLTKYYEVEKVEGNGLGTDNSVYFHVGANTNQVINTTFGDMRAKALGLTGTDDRYTKDPTVNNGSSSTSTEKGLNISTRAGANTAIDVIDNAITKISEERSKYGAIQNRLEYTINNVDTTSENMTSAESTIRDVDMASEMMELTKNQILQQASQAMLSQAMQRPQQVLQLLQG
ncbi:MAG: hypothetical protein MJ211_15940, partial [Bacteroidales bacterium]|nr:hypothetical protein [Bacteroidales bacterium]